MTLRKIEGLYPHVFYCDCSTISSRIFLKILSYGNHLPVFFSNIYTIWELVAHHTKWGNCNDAIISGNLNWNITSDPNILSAYYSVV